MSWPCSTPGSRGSTSRSHLFHAACVPLSQLELLLGDLVPRRATPIVWCDADGSDGGLARRAAARAAELGWTDCSVLAGGTEGWAAAGAELYSGVNVPSKAFGEYVEHTFDTPRLPATEVKELLDAASRGEADVRVLDSRPMNEFRNMSIPTGTDCPGAELVHRVKEMAPDPATTVIVNCAGRTRSIIGAQSLINAGAGEPGGGPGERDDGLGAGRLHRRAGPARSTPPTPGPRPGPGPRPQRPSVGQRFGVRRLSLEEVDAWRAETDRTTYLLDVRTAEEFEAGHLAGSRHAAGGQLVQATDEYVATRGARLVLIDDNEVRATMTASWLRQLGWDDAAVLSRRPAGGRGGRGVPADRTPGPGPGRAGPDHQGVRAGPAAGRRAGVGDGARSRAPASSTASGATSPGPGGGSAADSTRPGRPSATCRPSWC